MSVYKRGSLWWYKFQFQGSSIRKPTKFTNRTAALRAEAKHKADLLDRRAGLSQKKIAPKFKEHLKEFLAWYKQHHRPKTTALHSTNCDTLLRFFKGHWLDEIDQAAVERYKSDRLKEDRRNADDGSKVTGATVNRSLTTLKLMFGRAEKCGFGVSNPVRGVAYLPESTGRIRVVSFQEELAYLSKASQPLRDIAQTILDTGLRPEEVFRIRVENIDFAARTIFNPFGKTKAARRTVTMTEAVWTALKRRAKMAKGSYVFPSETPGSTHRLRAQGAQRRNTPCWYQAAFCLVRHASHICNASGNGWSRSPNSERNAGPHFNNDDHAIRSSGSRTETVGRCEAGELPHQRSN